MVTFAWMIFRANSLGDVKGMVKIMILQPVFKDIPAMNMSVVEWCLLGISIVILLFVDFLREKGVSVKRLILERPTVIRTVIYALGIGCIIIFGVYGVDYDASQFLYFQF